MKRLVVIFLILGLSFSVGAKEKKKVPYRGTSIVFQNMVSAFTFSKSADLTYNPYYAMSLSFLPRWYFTDNLSMRLSISVSKELTNADDTTLYRETVLSDTSLSLVNTKIYEEKFTKIRFGARFDFTLPTSKVSQARSLILGLTPGLIISRHFKLLKGLDFIYQFRYTKYLNRYTTMRREGVFPSGDNNIGVRNPSHQFFNLFGVTQYFIKDLYLSVTFGVLNYFVYPGSAVTAGDLGIYGAEEDEEILPPPRHGRRDLFVSSIEIGYSLLSYLTLSLNISTQGSQLAPDSTIRQPFANRYTTLILGASLGIDPLVKAVKKRIK
jgi:hypothetical protein